MIYISGVDREKSKATNVYLFSGEETFEERLFSQDKPSPRGVTCTDANNNPLESFSKWRTRTRFYPGRFYPIQPVS